MADISKREGADRRHRRLRGIGVVRAAGNPASSRCRGAAGLADRTPIQATVHDDPGKTIRPDLTIDEAERRRFRRADPARRRAQSGSPADDKPAIALIRAFADAGKPVGAICHGPWLLVEADLVRGRTATSWP